MRVKKEIDMHFLGKSQPRIILINDYEFIFLDLSSYLKAYSFQKGYEYYLYEFKQRDILLETLKSAPTGSSALILASGAGPAYKDSEIFKFLNNLKKDKKVFRFSLTKELYDIGAEVYKLDYLLILF